MLAKLNALRVRKVRIMRLTGVPRKMIVLSALQEGIHQQQAQAPLSNAFLARLDDGAPEGRARHAAEG